MNGRPIAEKYIAKLSELKDGTGKLKLHNLPAYSFDLAIVAENENGVSDGKAVRFNYVTINARGKPQVIKAPKIKGKLYVLAIGNSDYQDENVSPLNYADDDAEDFAAFMKTQQGKDLYTKVEVNRLLNSNRTDILDIFPK